MPWVKSQSRKSEDVERLFDFASSHQDGFTYPEVEAEFGWQRSYFFKVVRWLRAFFADDKITLPCEPEGSNSPWLYRLTVDREAVRVWHNNRILDSAARLETMENVAKSAVNATDGRSLDGKRARVMLLHLGRLREDLERLEAEAV